MKRKPNARRDKLASIAMHGILTACSSPQYYERLTTFAVQEKTIVPRVIAHLAYDIAESMLIESGKVNK